MPTRTPRLDDPAIERRLLRRGRTRIAGVDEAGRGAWAGPVAAAAVILPPAVYADRRLLWGVTDSKRLTPAQRRAWEPQIRRLAIAVSVSFVSHRDIDERGIARASRDAMLKALDGLPVRPDHVLVDAFPLPAGCAYADRQQAIIRADACCLAVAAASICAKVARDRLMRRLHATRPAYGFADNKGYGTPRHRAALHSEGVTAVHRRTFRPVAARSAHALDLVAG